MESCLPEKQDINNINRYKNGVMFTRKVGHQQYKQI